MNVPVWNTQHPARDSFGRFVAESQRTQWTNVTYEEARSVRFVPNRIFCVDTLAFVYVLRSSRSVFGFLCILCDPAQECGFPGGHADDGPVEPEVRQVLPGVLGNPELLDRPGHPVRAERAPVRLARCLILIIVVLKNTAARWPCR